MALPRRPGHSGGLSGRLTRTDFLRARGRTLIRQSTELKISEAVLFEPLRPRGSETRLALASFGWPSDPLPKRDGRRSQPDQER
jgi:hypothetical protein